MGPAQPVNLASQTTPHSAVGLWDRALPLMTERASPPADEEGESEPSRRAPAPAGWAPSPGCPAAAIALRSLSLPAQLRWAQGFPIRSGKANVRMWERVLCVPRIATQCQGNTRAVWLSPPGTNMAAALLTQLLIKYLNMAFYMKASRDLLNVAEEIFQKPNEDLFMKKSKSINPEIGQAGKPKLCIIFLTSLAHFLMWDKIP